MARPSKLTTETLDKLDAVADDGLGIQAACEKAGIDSDTFRRWEAKDDSDPLLERFRGIAARVRARANWGLLDKCDSVIAKALDDDEVRLTDRAALAIQFKRLNGAQRIELTGKDGGPLEVIERASRDLDSRLDRLAERQRQSEGTPGPRTDDR